MMTNTTAPHAGMSHFISVPHEHITRDHAHQHDGRQVPFQSRGTKITSSALPKQNPI